MAFGLDRLAREIRESLQRFEQQLEQLACAVGSNSDIVAALRAAVCALDERVERTGQAVMAGVQELQDALNELDSAVGTEIDQINAKLDELRGQVAPNLQAQVDQIKAATQRVAGIIADAVPEPTPAPEPGPEPPPPSPSPERGRR